MVTQGNYQNVESELTAKISDLLNKDQETQLTNEWKKLISIAYNDRGLMRYKQVEFVKAVEDYTNSLKYFSLASAYYNRGTIRYRMLRQLSAYNFAEEFNEALEDMKRALEIDSQFTEAHIAIEKCYLAINKTSI